MEAAEPGAPPGQRAASEPQEAGDPVHERAGQPGVARRRRSRPRAPARLLPPPVGVVSSRMSCFGPALGVPVGVGVGFGVLVLVGVGCGVGVLVGWAPA